MSNYQRVVLGDSPAGWRFLVLGHIFFCPRNPDLVILDSRNPYWDGSKPFKTSEILIVWGRTIHSPAILGYHLGTRLLTNIDTWGTCALDKEPNAGRTARRTRELGLPDLLGARCNPSHKNGDLGMVMTWGLTNWVHWVLSSITSRSHWGL